MGGCRDRDPPLASLRPLPGPAQRRRASSGPPPGGHRCSMAAAWAGSAPLTAATAAAAASAAAAAAAGPAPTRPSGAGPAPSPASRRSPPASHGAAAPSAPRAPLQPPRSVPLPPGGAGPLWKGCVCVCVERGGGVEGGRCSPPFSAAGRGRGNGAGRARCCSTAASWGAPPLLSAPSRSPRLLIASPQALPAPPVAPVSPPCPSCVPSCPLFAPGPRGLLAAERAQAPPGDRLRVLALSIRGPPAPSLSPGPPSWKYSRGQREEGRRAAGGPR